MLYFGGRHAEAADVVLGLTEVLPRSLLELQQGVDGVRHDNEGEVGVRNHETAVPLAGGSGMDHLRSVVGGAAAGQGGGADEPGEADAAEVDAAARRIRRQLPVVVGVIAPQMLAVELVAAIHGGGEVPLGFPDLAGALLDSPAGESVGGDGAGEREFHRAAVPLRLLDGHLQQSQGAARVHAVGGIGGEFGPRGQKSRQMIDGVNFVFALQSLQQSLVQNVSGDASLALNSDPVVDRPNVQGDQVLDAFIRQPADEPVPHFTAGSGDQGGGLSHRFMLLFLSLASPAACY